MSRHALALCLSMIPAQTRSAFVARENRFPPNGSSPRAGFSGSCSNANRRRDVPNATNGVPFATSSPSDGDGYACGDADGPSPHPRASHPLLLARYSGRSLQSRRQQRWHQPHLSECDGDYSLLIGTKKALDQLGAKTSVLGVGY